MENGRICIRCKLEKSWSEFDKLKRNQSGYRGVCKPCRVLEAKINTKAATPVDHSPAGIVLELKLVPHERFWRGFNRLLDMFLEDILKENKNTKLSKKSQKNNY